MKYSVILSDKAEKVFSKLNNSVANRIAGWLKKHIDGCENPRQHGHALTGDLGGLWRYRIGDYRVICQIKDDKLIVLVVNAGHRRDIYN